MSENFYLDLRSIKTPTVNEHVTTFSEIFNNRKSSPSEAKSPVFEIPKRKSSSCQNFQKKENILDSKDNELIKNQDELLKSQFEGVDEFADREDKLDEAENTNTINEGNASESRERVQESSPNIDKITGYRFHEMADVSTEFDNKLNTDCAWIFPEKEIVSLGMNEALGMQLVSAAQIASINNRLNDESDILSDIGPENIFKSIEDIKSNIVEPKLATSVHGTKNDTEDINNIHDEIFMNEVIFDKNNRNEINQENPKVQKLNENEVPFLDNGEVNVDKLGQAIVISDKNENTPRLDASILYNENNNETSNANLLNEGFSEFSDSFQGSENAYSEIAISLKTEINTQEKSDIVEMISTLKPTKTLQQNQLMANRVNGPHQLSSKMELPEVILKQLEQIHQGYKNWANIDFSLPGGEEVNLYLNINNGGIKTRFSGDISEVKQILESGWDKLVLEAVAKGIRLDPPEFIHNSKSRSDASKKAQLRDLIKSNSDDNTGTSDSEENYKN